jgi:hypothetical protein
MERIKKGGRIIKKENIKEGRWMKMRKDGRKEGWKE